MPTPEPPLDPSPAAPGPTDASETAAAAAGARPYWIPPGVDLTAWPPALQAAVAGVINPAYDALVLKAAPGPMQSTGITIVHLLWLEILEQVDLGRLQADLQPGAEHEQVARTTILERHFRLVLSKLKATELLLRLEEFRQRTGPWTDPWRPAAPPIPMPPASPDHGNSKFC